MPLKYVGPKPLISAHGIEFDHNKEDKFVYLGFVVELIHALDHEYIEDRRYIATIVRQDYKPDDILELLKSYDDQLGHEIIDRQKITTDEIEDELIRARENRVLCEEEREVLIKNIELLRNYLIQRSVNKTVYYSGIMTLARIIQKGHISYIGAPMLPVNHHVFHSIQGALHKLHPAIDSEITIFEENGHLHERLEIKGV